MNTTATIPPTASPEVVDHCIETCNSLLRGEISAVETYGQAIEKFSAEPETRDLAEIRIEHERAVQALRENVLSMKGLPEIESGSWGSTTKAIQATANFFGENSAIRSLQQGEEIGRAAYEAALEDDQVMANCKMLIRDRLLPLVNQHITRLQSLLDSRTGS